MIGTRIGDRYLIEAPLGEGGMGTVYRAMDERLGRPVAVKLLLPELGGDTEAIARFEREARATARLTHPGIVQIHDFGTTPAPSGRGMASYLVMELADRHDLARARRGRGVEAIALVETSVEERPPSARALSAALEPYERAVLPSPRSPVHRNAAWVFVVAALALAAAWVVMR